LNSLKSSFDSSIFGGSYNCVDYNSSSANILSGYSNKIFCDSNNNSILSGNNHIICCYSNNSSLVAGNFNTINCHSSSSAIIGGRCNIIDKYANYSSIIGSEYSTIFCSNRSIIIGGSNLILNQQDDAVLVPKLISQNAILTGTISNATPTSWKLGDVVNDATIFDTTRYIEISIDGTTYKLALVT
jgi:hypothetical protein